MGNGQTGGCSMISRTAKPYEVKYAYGGYMEEGAFKPFEQIPDLDGDGKPELGMTVEESVAWSGETCSGDTESFDVLTNRERPLVHEAIRSGQSSLTLPRTYVVQMSSVPSLRSSLTSPQNPLLNAQGMKDVARGADIDSPFAVPLPTGDSVKIGDIVQLESQIMGGMLMVREETGHIESLKMPDGVTHVSVNVDTSIRVATAGDLQSTFSLDRGSAVVPFRVVNITPGPVEGKRVAHELTRISIVPKGFGKVPETSELSTKEDGTEVLDTTVSVLEIALQAPGITVQKKGWFDWLFK